ncbi:hypothetical protein EPUS_02101 [Endocarpon pusillum Z07020]|uniref:Phospholipase/carboxylesterase/thioesterase domain-containing protein n=1 Tax=Endocarpon pusillum (strain Z07020 / HMAS-L-300199) TaxID=1263415 RepID=U1HSN4_ENDPU|nr:uncharacterized protein EPUS_02101 [Endocarpon pusillum Z07020]ERF72214.1 hypothetical protein EPUS_02101 [Endocarpon pusillum Z07020]
MSKSTGLEGASSTLDSTASDDESVQNYPPPYIVEPTSPHTHTAILLHGLGSNGRAFGSFFLTASVLSNDKDSPYSRPLNVLYPSMKWVFPGASLRRSKRFKGIKLFSWFEIFSIQDPSYREETQTEGLIHSSQYLRDLIFEEVKMLKGAVGGEERVEKRIVLGGLSQGCAMSLTTLLSLDFSLGGWVGMSGFMPMRGIFEDALNADAQDGDKRTVLQRDTEQDESDVEALIDTQSIDPTVQALNTFRQNVLSLPPPDSRSPANVLETPAFYGHGNEDERVACRLGDELVRTLEGMHMSVKHQVYQGLGHWIQAPEEIDDMISVFSQYGAWPDHVDEHIAS